MYYDRARHAYLSSETGELVIQLEPGDIVPDLGPGPAPSTPSRREESPLERSDRLLAEQLARGDGDVPYGSRFLGGPSTPSRLPLYPTGVGSSSSSSSSSGSGVGNSRYDVEAAFPGGAYSLNEGELYSASGSGSHDPFQVAQHDGRSGGGGWFSSFQYDLTLAHALQALEFEIDAETQEERLRYEREEEQDNDFRRKEYGASSCRKQMLTISTFVCVAQICILIAECTWDGMAPESENPMLGPPATTMVRFGAKDASLILDKGQWWRLISPIFLHAGVIHLISNVLIQLRVGGYLNLVFGNAKWAWIYLVSGVFGNIVSCCFLPDSVGVGSSGALLGMLSAWIVWIVFRWKKIPDQCRGQRNCQLGVVLVSVAITLGMSFSQYVDWGAHFGGALMGALWGMILLSSELDNKMHAQGLRVFCIICSIGLWIGALAYMKLDMKPSTANWPVYAQNDDWHHHNGQAE